MWTALRRIRWFRRSWRAEPDPEVQPCSKCLRCVEACPSGALHYRDRIWSLDLEACHLCGACAAVCPNILINAEKPFSA